MKIVIIIAITFVVMGGYALSVRRTAAQLSSQTAKQFATKSATQPAANSAAQSASPTTSFYCNIKALNPEETRRHAALGESLRAAKRSVRELADGFEFELPGDAATFQTAAEWSAMERRCCPFFEFNLRMERDNGPLWLRLTGRDGVKQFIRADLGNWLSARL
jgi:hypothetical protein